MMQEHIDVQQIPLKVYRSPDRLTVAAPMPGLGPEDITIEITAEGYLVLTGRLRGALRGDKELLVDEWSVGPYRRSFPLPASVNGPGATVTYGNGVLVVAMPLTEATRPAVLTLERVGPARGAGRVDAA
ncbi:MAG: Hsp20/alpha crystallin family protein [Candidatus Rokuibacteriota bacterium]